MALRALVLAILATLPPSAATGEVWTHVRITALPDSAFAVVEVAPDGRKIRHLPHHDETGAVDLAHLRAALARLGQVKWLDPASEVIARRHLDEHVRNCDGDPTTSHARMRCVNRDPNP